MFGFVWTATGVFMKEIQRSTGWEKNTEASSSNICSQSPSADDDFSIPFFPEALTGGKLPDLEPLGSDLPLAGSEEQ